MNRRINDALRTSSSIIESVEADDDSGYRSKKRKYQRKFEYKK